MQGITPVVSVILLLLITISIVGFSLIFFQRTAQSAGEEAQTQLQQQLGAAAERFELVNIDRNKVYIKNTGTASLQNLRFYVDGSAVQNTTPISIAPNTVGEVPLNNSQLAQVPGDKLKVTSVGFSQEEQAKFYGKETAAYWKFDESDGRTVKDYSGNGNDGTFVGENWNDGDLKPACPNCPVQTTGKYGNAVGFDGVDDYVNIGNLGIPANGVATVEGWFYFKDRAKDRGSDMTLYNNLLYQHSANNYFYISDTNDRFNFIPNLNTWYHIVLTYSGGTGSANLYVNGIVYSIINQGGDSNTIPALSSFAIGGTDHNYFNGTIDEVRVYNRALTQDEIRDDMNSAYPINRTVASYSFEKIEPKALDTHNIVKGRYGAAMSFDGVDDYVNVPDSDSLDVTTALTIEAWVKPTKKSGCGGGYTPILGKNGEQWVVDGVYALTANDCADNFIAYTRYGTVTTSSGNEIYTVTTGSATENVWQHVVMTKDSSDLKIYLNGVLKQSISAPLPILTRDSPAIIGNRDGGGRALNGTIDEVRILNVAR